MRGRIGGMKAISASIIVLAGAVLITVHGDVPNFIGCVIGAAGFLTWAAIMLRRNEPPN